MSRRYSFCMNWTSIFHKYVIILYCIVYNCFAEYTFTTQPESVLVVEGQTASLTCEWRPLLNEGHKVKWTHIFSSSDYVEIDSSNGKYNLTSELKISYLSIFPFRSSDIGPYRCDISGKESDDAYVGTIACSPGNNDGDLGTKPSCDIIIAQLGIDLYWYKNGTLIDTPIQTDNQLYLRALSREDDGAVFTCKAKYGSQHQVIGTCETTPLVLTIDATLEKTPPGPLTVGDTFSLICSGNGDPDKYMYQWMYNNKVLDSSADYSGNKYGIEDKVNIFTFRNVNSNNIDSIINCIVSRLDRDHSSVSYVIELPALTTNFPTKLMTLSPTTKHLQSATAFGNGGNEETGDSTTTMIVVGVVAITLVIFATILTICFLIKRRKKKYGNLTKPESLPLEEPTYDDIQDKATDSESKNMSDKNDPVQDKLITDSTVGLYDEPAISKSSTRLDSPETLYAEPTMPTADDNDYQFSKDRSLRYDTPRKTVSLDKLDAPLETSLSVDDASEMYAKPNKTRSRESIDAMYAKPNNTGSKENIDELYAKPNKTGSKENIDELYSKPIKSTGSTPKSAHKDPIQKNVEGLMYADIDFQNGTFPSPAPKDYGLDYASVQFNINN